MISKIISHYKILEKPRQKAGGLVGEAGPNDLKKYLERKYNGR